MAAEGAIRVRGLNELVDSFKKADRELAKEVRAAIKDAGEIVRFDAQNRAVTEIRNIGSVWPRMRLGITGRGNIVYVVPRTRRTRPASFRRPNLGLLLLDDAMVPALEQNRERVRLEVERAVVNVAQNAGLIETLHAIGQP